MVEVGVDPVVDDVHAIRGDVEQPQHVDTRLVADGDDGVGRLERGPLDPAAHVVAATELLPLPGAQRLQGMDSDHERDAVGEAREQPREVRVPGVGVDDVGLDRIGDHGEIARERGEHRPQALIGLRQVVGGRIAGDAPPRLGIGPCTERAYVEVDQRAEVSRELVDVDAGAAVDCGWELVGQDQGAHAPSLACLLPVAIGSGLSPLGRSEKGLDLGDVERLRDDRRPCADLGLPHRMRGRAYQDRDVGHAIVVVELAGQVATSAIREVVVKDEQRGSSRIERPPKAGDAREALGQPAGLLGNLAQQLERADVVVHHEQDRRADGVRRCWVVSHLVRGCRSQAVHPDTRMSALAACKGHAQL